MRRTLVVTAICFCVGLAGCNAGTFSENKIAALSSPPKTIALGEFKGNDAGIAQLFADTVSVKLSKAGFKITTDQNQADVIVTGTCAYKMPCFTIGINDWILNVKTNSGSPLITEEYHHPHATGDIFSGWKSHQEVINELSHRLVKALQ